MKILHLFEIAFDMTIYGKEGPHELKRGDVLAVFDGQTVRVRAIAKQDSKLPEFPIVRVPL